MAKDDVDLIKRVLPGKFYFQYLPHLAPILGSPNEALLISYLLFWHGKGARKGFTYKTERDMEFETGLSEYKQRTAIEACKAKGFLIVEYRGIPRKRHFKLSLDELINYITGSSETTRLAQELLNDSQSENNPTITKSDTELSKEVDSIYRLFLSEHGLTSNSCRLTPARRVLLIERLHDLGHARLKQAVINSSRSPYWNGEHDGERRGSIDFILGSYEHAEMLANLREDD